MLTLTIEAKTVSELKDNLIKVWTELDGHNGGSIPGEPVSHELPEVPQTTGSVDQDQAIVPTGTPSREDLNPKKRTRRTKAEIEAEKKATSVEQMAPLADRPANSRPVTQGFLVDTNPNLPQQPVVGMDLAQPGADKTVVVTNSAELEQKIFEFKTNFTQKIFLLLQDKKIDQDYIAERMKEYGLKDLTTMPKHEGMVEHFYAKLVAEGRMQ